MKVCKTCKQEKPLSEYHKAKFNPDGLKYECKACANSRSKSIRESKLDSIKEYSKNYYQANKQSYLDRKNTQYREEPLYRLKTILRSTTRNRIKAKARTEDIIGCSYIEFQKYFEGLFTEGMSWDNMGELEIDHIMPLASASNEEELYKLNHYTNLQPLWRDDNRSKGAKVL